MPKPPPSRRDGYRFFHAITTRWHDNDSYGHVNNATYYAYFDTAVNVFLLGDGPPAFNGPVRALAAETGCRYLSELRYPDRVTVGLRVARLGTSSVRYELAVFRNDGDEASAEGHFVHVYVDGATHRPVPIPPEMRERLRGIAAPGAGA